MTLAEKWRKRAAGITLLDPMEPFALEEVADEIRQCADELEATDVLVFVR